MKKRKRLVCLAGLCIFMALALIYFRMGTMSENGTVTERIYVAQHKLDTITRENPEGMSWTLFSQNGQWVWSEDSTFPVNQEMASMMAVVAAGPEIVTSMEKNAENMERCGLDRPAFIVTAAGREEQYVLYFGSQNSATGDYYVCAEGIDRIYTTDQKNYNIFHHDLLDLAETETLPGVRLDQVSGFHIFQDADTLFLQKETVGDTDQWMAEDGAGGVWRAEPLKAEETISRFLRIRMIRMAAFLPSEDELESFGLKTPEIVLTLDYVPETGSGAQTDQKQQFQLLFGKMDETGMYRYCWFAESRGVYLAAESDLQELLNRRAEEYADLYLTATKPGLVKTIDIDTPDADHQIVITAGTEAGRRRIRWNEVEIEETMFNRFYYELYGLKGDKLPDVNQTETISGEEILRIVIDPKPENREELVVVTYDRNYDLVTINGESGILINKQKINALLRQIGQIAP